MSTTSAVRWLDPQPLEDQLRARGARGVHFSDVRLAAAASAEMPTIAVVDREGDSFLFCVNRDEPGGVVQRALDGLVQRLTA